MPKSARAVDSLRIAVPTASAVGRLVRVGTNPSNQRLQVVGIVRDTLFRGPRQGHRGSVFLNYWQADKDAQTYPSLVVRTTSEPQSLADALDRLVRDSGHEYTIGTRTLNDMLDQSLAQERLLAILAAAFAVLGLVRAAVGIHGLLQYSIARRMPEIGLRVALGASAPHISRLVLGNAIELVLAGALIGGPAAWAANRAVSGLIYHRAAITLRPAALGIGVLLFTGLVAACLPLRRALSVDPLTALRSE
jgi:putative ABC transport system permease protein